MRSPQPRSSAAVLLPGIFLMSAVLLAILPPSAPAAEPDGSPAAPAAGPAESLGAPGAETGESPAPVRSPVAEAIQGMILRRAAGEGFSCNGEMVCGIGLMPHFYGRRAYLPAWSTDRGVTDEALELLEVVRGADAVGLEPSDYHLQALERLVENVDLKLQLGMAVTPRERADLDVLLTDAFLLLGSHLYGGRVNPETVHSEWVAYRYDRDLTAVLEKALAAGRIADSLRGLQPPHRGYASLQSALARYRSIVGSGGWPAIPEGPSLRPGDWSEALPLIRRRLRIEGDLEDFTPPDPLRFDDLTERAVQRFQMRHGLAVDGVIGEQTLRMMNVPAEVRVEQLKINLERWRWLPHYFGERYIVVNIADFSLKVYDGGRPAGRMRVIVGRPYRKTPVFSSRMTYLVFNPYWNVPHTIAVEDLLPKIQKDAAFLPSHGFQVFSGWSKDAPEMDPAGIEWTAYNRHNFPYRLRQAPGEQNALGRIKFMFPNKFAVYLHDTPSRRLFDATVRNFSSGCIRVERPLWLAEFVLGGQPEWSSDRIEGLLDTGVRTRMPLERPVDVHLLYWTAWVEEGGQIHFRRDIYDRDRPLARALAERAPAS